MNRYQIVARLKEPSTWAGLSALGLLFGVHPGTLDVVSQAGIAIAASAAVLLGEKGRAPTVQLPPAGQPERRSRPRRKGDRDA